MSESRELAGMARLMRSIVTCIAGSLILGRAVDLADARALVPDDGGSNGGMNVGVAQVAHEQAPCGTSQSRGQVIAGCSARWPFEPAVKSRKSAEETE